MKTGLTSAQLQRNVRLQVFLRIFQKRVFLPLAAIYFMSVAGFDVQKIGLLATWFALLQVIVEVPTGMYADRFGKVQSERIGAFLNICATLLYVLEPNTVGIFTGMALEAIGYSFFGGACEALLHDTLQAQGRIAAYTKTLARIQSISLAVNAVLVGLVPLTYAIDPRLPFVVGTVAYLSLFGVTFLLHEVYPGASREAPTMRPSLRTRLKVVLQYRRLVPFLLVFGFISALYTAPSDFANLAFKELGLAPERLGFVFAAGSIVGVGFGWVLHWFKKMPFYVYALTDWLVLWVWLASVWTRNLEVMVAVNICTMAFWRYRRIIYQEKLLEVLGTNRKATALSVMNNASQMNELYIPVVFGVMAGAFTIPQAYGIASLVLLAVLPAWLWVIRGLSSRAVTTCIAIPEL
ncbi:MFS transporter [Candidatus Saccharibacteria bacterium]|nr:MFS transporter [Candidatus Saccharibacteria bacterium]